MPSRSYVVTAVGKLKPSNRRAVAFLCSSDPREANARAVFDALEKKHERTVRSNFEQWIDGFHNPKHFHGWPGNPKYKECWTFKWRERRVNQRFYGFLFHPKRTTNPAFQVCILVSHATKQEWETDESELDHINAIRVKPAVIAAILQEFPDGVRGNKRWVN